MYSYIEAHRMRMIRNDKRIRRTAFALSLKGCNVYISKNGRLSFMCIVRGNKSCYIQWGDTRHHWELLGDLDPNKKQGSGYNIKSYPETNTKGPHIGIFINEILNRMAVMPKGHHEKLMNATHLKLYPGKKKRIKFVINGNNGKNS